MTTPSERRIKFTLQYDGSGFYGWQVQPGVRTVQSEFEAALSRLADRPVRTTAAGRTDRGVHAIGQVATAVLPGKWGPAAIHRSLNAILPDDLWVRRAEQVPEAFHARHHAVARSYVYRVGTAPLSAAPFRGRWCWPLDDSPDRAVLEAAAERIVGRQSFRGFAKAGQPERGYQCTVHHAGWVAWPRFGLEFRVAANRFLHHMVRYLMGTFMDIAVGRRPAADLDALLAEPAEDVTTSAPAPAEGLFLAEVCYTADELADSVQRLQREDMAYEDLP